MAYASRRVTWLLVLTLLLPFCLAACSTVAVSGRKQLNLIPDSEMLAMSQAQYGEFLGENKLSDNAEETAMVKRCGARIQKAVERYFADRGKSGELRDYQWEFNLVESDQVNAWCMPGGKVVFYTGIMPICQDENGVAVVMGHEVAHAIAEHGSERMSQALLVQMGGMVLSEAVKDKPEQTQQYWMAAFGLGAEIGVMLPFSRTHESEADHLGLVFMAMAGYDPNYAVSFWQRMSADKSGAAPPEFLSTHPSDETRIRQLMTLMPEAMQYYKPQGPTP